MIFEKLLTRTIDCYKEKHKESLSAACALFGVDRQVYYRNIKRKEKRQQVAGKVVVLVKELRMRMPRTGTRKLYHLLRLKLNDLGVVGIDYSTFLGPIIYSLLAVGVTALQQTRIIDLGNIKI